MVWASCTAGSLRGKRKNEYDSFFWGGGGGKMECKENLVTCGDMAVFFFMYNICHEEGRRRKGK